MVFVIATILALLIIAGIVSVIYHLIQRHCCKEKSFEPDGTEPGGEDLENREALQEFNKTSQKLAVGKPSFDTTVSVNTTPPQQFIVPSTDLEETV